MKLLIVFIFLMSGVVLSAIPDHISDREKRKFVESPTRPGQTAVEVTIGGPSPVPVNIVNPQPIKSVLVDRETGTSMFIAASGQAETAELIRLVGGNFEDPPLLRHVWQHASVGDGSATIIEGEAVLMTGTVANASASMQTFNRAPFTTATFNKGHFAVATPGFFNPSVTRIWGVFDPVLSIKPAGTNGVCFNLEGGVITIIRRKAGIEVDRIAEVDFNGGNPYIKDDNIHVYEIVYNAGSAFFYQGRKLIHRMIYVDEVGYETVHLKAGLQIINTFGNTVNNIVKTRGFSISRIGNAAAVDERFSINTAGTQVIKNTPGIFKRLIINDTGVGGASIDFFDDPACVNNPLETVDLTDALVDLEYGYLLNNGLCAVSDGAGFNATVVHE